MKLKTGRARGRDIQLQCSPASQVMQRLELAISSCSVLCDLHKIWWSLLDSLRPAIACNCFGLSFWIAAVSSAIILCFCAASSDCTESLSTSCMVHKQKVIRTKLALDLYFHPDIWVDFLKMLIRQWFCCVHWIDSAPDHCLGPDCFGPNICNWLRLSCPWLLRNEYLFLIAIVVKEIFVVALCFNLIARKTCMLIQVHVFSGIRHWQTITSKWTLFCASAIQLQKNRHECHRTESLLSQWVGLTAMQMPPDPGATKPLDQLDPMAVKSPCLEVPYCSLQALQQCSLVVAMVVRIHPLPLQYLLNF